MLNLRAQRRKSISGHPFVFWGGVPMRHISVRHIAGAILRGAILVTVIAGPALAQQNLPKSSSDPLQEICTGFLAQSGQGVSGDRNRLCVCLSRETKSRLTEPEMKAYARAAETGQPPPDAIMQKVMGIATACLTEAAK
jgi:hypothetical protein